MREARDMGRSLVPTALLLLGVAVIAAPDAAAMTEFSERLGNEPVTEDLDWPIGVFALANLESRVLHRSTAGGIVMAKDDEFFYRGGADELNEALALFAKIEAERREVVVLPGAPEEKLWGEGEPVQYDWKLHVPGTYRREEAQREKGTHVYSGWPNMTVHVGGWVDLDGVEIPPGVTVLGPADLTARYVEGLRSDDMRVRYSAATNLQRAASYADEALLPLFAALDDEELYVRVAAAETLSKFDLKAAAALPKLRAMLEDKDMDPGPRKSLSEAAQRIEEAERKDEKRFRADLARIESFRKSLAADQGALDAEGDG
jgi:hypothetical protein